MLWLLLCGLWLLLLGLVFLLALTIGSPTPFGAPSALKFSPSSILLSSLSNLKPSLTAVAIICDRAAIPS
jgi:hypothetical protein